jgi:pimeloyl-ACP methyl ester carboxylesterase
VQGVKAIYAQGLTVQACVSQPVMALSISTSAVKAPAALERETWCAKELRNPDNAPFVLHHQKRTKKVIVLFHGLSDSPFYLASIANSLAMAGHNVVVGLLPGHGLRENALAVLHDDHLAQLWREHVRDVFTAAKALGEEVVVGGFSTGGALAIDYALQYPTQVHSVVLFSAALSLPGNAETLTKVPFARYVAKWTELDYATSGPNPYKYPTVSSYAATELMAIIRDIRAMLSHAQRRNIPLFVSHSHADNVTPIDGVIDLLGRVDGDHVFLEIEEAMQVCHADLPLNKTQIKHLGKQPPERYNVCGEPKTNPVHGHMLSMLNHFLTTR